jgi:tetratricopeptide (TPR) repeat protein
MAMKYNKELTTNYTFALNYGLACYSLKLTTSPYYLFFWGNQLYKLQRTLEAIETLTKAYELSSKDSLFKVALSNILTEAGTDYFLKGAPGTAIATWEKSLQIDPEQIENWYYLSFVYKFLAFYKRAVFAGKQFTLLSNNSILNANTYANMGDACYWLRDFLLARIYYEKSQMSVYFLNYRAGRALDGT